MIAVPITYISPDNNLLTNGNINPEDLITSPHLISTNTNPLNCLTLCLIIYYCPNNTVISRISSPYSIKLYNISQMQIKIAQKMKPPSFHKVCTWYIIGLRYHDSIWLIYSLLYYMTCSAVIFIVIHP